MPLDDIYPTDALTQYLMGPNQPESAMQPAQSSMVNPPTNMSSPMISAATGAVQPQDETPINIDGWNPHHRTTLGAIADIGLALLGLPIAPFKKHVQRENLQEAMEGFTNDPLNSIRRLSKIPGMEEKAWKLFEDYQQIHSSDAEKQQRMDYYAGLNEDKARNVISSYYGSFAQSKDPSASYQKMLPNLKNFAKNRGFKDDQIASMLPDQYDPDVGNSVMIGGVAAKDQIRLNQDAAYKSARLGQLDRQISNSDAARAATLAETKRNHTTMEHIAQERVDKPTSVAAKGVLAKLPANSPEKTMIHSDKDANNILYFRNGKWRMLRQTSKKGQPLQMKYLGDVPGQ